MSKRPNLAKATGEREREGYSGVLATAAVCFVGGGRLAGQIWRTLVDSGLVIKNLLEDPVFLPIRWHHHKPLRDSILLAVFDQASCVTPFLISCTVIMD